MFVTLLAVTFFISLAVALVVVYTFGKPIENILRRIISDEISQAWAKYIKFAIYVVGVSSGVRIWELERYITPPQYTAAQVIELTRDRWILEVYRTIIGALQG